MVRNGGLPFSKWVSNGAISHQLKKQNFLFQQNTVLCFILHVNFITFFPQLLLPIFFFKEKFSVYINLNQAFPTCHLTVTER